jgi:hypothetical protein
LCNLASKGKRATDREAASRATYLVVRATASRKAADHAAAAYRAAAARETDTQAATPRAATWSLV